jgi:hypothetical protein
MMTVSHAEPDIRYGPTFCIGLKAQPSAGLQEKFLPGSQGRRYYLFDFWDFPDVQRPCNSKANADKFLNRSKKLGNVKRPATRFFLCPESLLIKTT